MKQSQREKAKQRQLELSEKTRALRERHHQRREIEMETEEPEEKAPFSAIFHKRSSVSPKPLALPNQDHLDMEERRASLPLYLRA